MLLTAILLIVLGILAASAVIIKKKPEAQQLINKLVSWQGWFGIVGLVWGLLILFKDVLPSLRFFSLPSLSFKILVLAYLVGAIVLIVLGFVFGFALISKFALGKSPEAQEKGNKMIAKLTSIQIPLGFAGLISAALIIIYGFFVIRI